jgi:hypothetical protein
MMAARSDRKEEGARQESLFAVQAARTAAVGLGETAVVASGYSYRADGAQVDDRYIDDVLTSHFGLYAGRGGLFERLRLAGASDDEIAASIPTMFSTGGGFRCEVKRGGDPALRFSSAVGELFALTGGEFADRLRRLFDIPHPKPAEEVSRVRRARLEEARLAERREAHAFVSRILRAQKKGGESAAPAVAAKLFADDCLTPAGERRAADETYRLLLAQGFGACAAMKAAGEIVSHAEFVWRRVAERWGNEPERADLYEPPAAAKEAAGDLFGAGGREPRAA